MIRGLIAQIGSDGASGNVIEYAGEAVRALSMEARMTICNMSIEGGARAGMIAPDETTLKYLRGRRFAPTGDAWTEAEQRWQNLQTDPAANFDTTIDPNTAHLPPF